MDCCTARALVWPPERPQLADGHVVAARVHIDGCAACASYFAQDRALLDLYDRARRATAPSPVRECVYNALARARREGLEARSGPSAPATREIRVAGGSRMTGEVCVADVARRLAGSWTVAGAAAVAMLVLLGPRVPGLRHPAGGPEVFVEDYLRRAVGQDRIETDDPSAVRRFLERELGVRIDPIRLAGLRLAGAEICLLEGRRGAMIVYEADGVAVSHYLVPRPNAPVRAPALSERVDGPGRGMPVVTWATRDLEQALVGDLGSARLLGIANAGSS